MGWDGRGLVAQLQAPAPTPDTRLLTPDSVHPTPDTQLRHPCSNGAKPGTQSHCSHSRCSPREYGQSEIQTHSDFVHPTPAHAQMTRMQSALPLLPATRTRTRAPLANTSRSRSRSMLTPDSRLRHPTSDRCVPERKARLRNRAGPQTVGVCGGVSGRGCGEGGRHKAKTLWGAGVGWPRGRGRRGRSVYPRRGRPARGEGRVPQSTMTMND
ncbi:hypothetical protein B0H11DRAFT_477517 [Mycena galericulata]|nr:hypothetical protein B0H11DRAFT_477517 [Mycena galericulata]